MRNKTVNHVLSRAKQSLRILESLDRETILRARSFVSQPLKSLRRRAGKKGLARLKQLGVSTWDEVYAELDALTSAIRPAKSAAPAKKKSKSSSGGKAAPSKQSNPQGTLPNG